MSNLPGLHPPGSIWSGCRGLYVCVYAVCMWVWVCGNILLKGNSVSMGVVWRSSVCFVDNWDLELKHRRGRWCVGFCFLGCLCLSSVWTSITLSAVCILVCPYPNSLWDMSQWSLKVPLLSVVRAWTDPRSAMAWPQAHLLSWWQMCQILAAYLRLDPQSPVSLSDRASSLLAGGPLPDI